MTARHVYVHVPFCARRCVYCDFAITVRRTVPATEFANTLAKEIALRFGDEPASPVRSIYLGGGTPSRLGADGIQDVLDVLQRRWEPEPGAEVTIEANPDDVTKEAAVAWKNAGVTRVSLGVQSFSPEVLRWMHRTHDVASIERAVTALREASIPSLSIDLIFALPDSLGRAWDCDLERAVGLVPDHMSVYGLTFEEHTPLMRSYRRGHTAEVADAAYAAEFLRADAFLTAAGFEHYEVSNYAKPGARAVHNSAYWSQSEYVGLGPSAHEFRCGVRRWNVRDYAPWVRTLGAGADPVAGSEVLSGEQKALEAVLLGLRTVEGIAWDEREREFVRSWTDMGWARTTADRVALTADGWLRMDALVGALTQRRSRY